MIFSTLGKVVIYLNDFRILVGRPSLITCPHSGGEFRWRHKLLFFFFFLTPAWLIKATSCMCVICFSLKTTPDSLGLARQTGEGNFPISKLSFSPSSPTAGLRTLSFIESKWDHRTLSSAPLAVWTSCLQLVYKIVIVANVLLWYYYYYYLTDKETKAKGG